MSTIPKRTVNHSLYLPSSERPILDLPHYARTCYTQSAHPPLLTTAQQSASLSDYQQNFARTIPADYHPDPSFKPKNNLTSGTAEFPDFKSAALWKSETHAAFVPVTAAARPAAVAVASRLASAPVVSVDLGLSTSAETFKDPHKIAAQTVATADLKSVVPGYQGFQPSNQHNPYVAAYMSGTRRERRETGNITENFQRVMAGYTGHQPSSGVNDRNPRQVNRRTETGQEFGVGEMWRLI
jgi:hypothetical protein